MYIYQGNNDIKMIKTVKMIKMMKVAVAAMISVKYCGSHVCLYIKARMKELMMTIMQLQRET